MKTISFDNGIKEFKIGDGILRFNPADPNVYARFMEAADKIEAVEAEMIKAGESIKGADGSGVLKLLAEADTRIKDILGWVFGISNDFNEILGGVNLMAKATNGERVVTNLLTALMPILQAGAEAYANDQIGNAVEKAQGNRAARRAKV